MSEEYKGYNIVADGQFGMKKVKSAGAGILPKELRGSFTNFREASRSIDIYLMKKETKKNGKASIAS